MKSQQTCDIAILDVNFSRDKGAFHIDGVLFFQGRDLGSISSTFFEQLLCAQIPKVQKKDSQVISVYLHFWDLLTQKLLMERR